MIRVVSGSAALAWVGLAAVIILTAAGQVLIKLSTIYSSSWSELVDHVLLSATTDDERWAMVCLGLGVGSYFVSTFLWLYVLAYLKLSRAYPLLSVAYILVYLAAIMIPILNETASWEKNLGIVIIIIGVFIVSLPSEAIQDKTT